MSIANTQNFELNLPSKSEQNWNVLLNQNFEKIDNEINKRKNEIGDLSQITEDNLVVAIQNDRLQLEEIAKVHTTIESQTGANSTEKLHNALTTLNAMNGGKLRLYNTSYTFDYIDLTNIHNIEIEGSSQGTIVNINGSASLVSGEIIGILFDTATYNKIKNITFKFSANMTAIRFGRLAGGFVYYNAFQDCVFQGANNNINQIGLMIENAFTNHFLNCNFRVFGKNINIKSGANRNIFEGCTFVAYNASGTYNIDIESGMANAFKGCDIEKGERWIRNTGGHVIFNDGCYFEGTVGAGSAELRGGLTDIHDCYLGDPQIYVYNGGDFILKNNYILKNGSSYAIYFWDANIPFFDCVGNYVTPQTSETVGRLYRGYDGGIQYTTDLSAWANATISKYCNINQERVYDVNTSTCKKMVGNFSDCQYQKGSLTGNTITSNGLLTAYKLKATQSSWQNPTQIGNYYLWFNGKDFRVKDSAPTYSTDGTIIITMP